MISIIFIHLSVLALCAIIALLIITFGSPIPVHPLDELVDLSVITGIIFITVEFIHWMTRWIIGCY